MSNLSNSFRSSGLNAIVAFLLLLTLAVPGTALALDFDSDFVDYESDWLLEEGSEAIQNASSITLSAANPSPKMRGRILIRPILQTTPEEIVDSVFTVVASAVSAPLAARVFYYDENRNYLFSEALFGTIAPGTIVTLGNILSPTAEVAGLRLRLYANAQEGSVTFERVTITTPGTPVPEPGTAVMMGLGLAGLASVRRRIA